MPQRTVNEIIIHCSATPNGRTTTVEQIRAWHQARGFTDIGYHWVVGIGGTLMRGRPETAIGAHAKGHNAHSVGVCMVGTDRFTMEQWATLRQCVEDLLERYPGARVIGHRDTSPDLDGDGQVEPHEWIKVCPGFNVSEWLANGMCPTERHLLIGRS